MFLKIGSDLSYERAYKISFPRKTPYHHHDGAAGDKKLNSSS
jgi:hypothetical protein